MTSTDTRLVVCAPVTWLKLSDDFADQCADADLSDAAFRMHVEGLLWTMRRETEGHLTGRDIRRFAESPDAEKAVEELVAADFWRLSGGGHQIIHHMEHQPEHALLARRREITAARQQRHRRRKAGIEVEPVVDEGPTSLYRWFDADDRLLYLGITNNLVDRNTSHTKGSSWADFARRSTVTPYDTRVDAEKAEDEALAVEQPLFNSRGNNAPEARSRLTAYLVAQGRIDLLEPVVSRG